MVTRTNWLWCFFFWHRRPLLCLINAKTTSKIFFFLEISGIKILERVSFACLWINALCFALRGTSAEHFTKERKEKNAHLFTPFAVFICAADNQTPTHFTLDYVRPALVQIKELVWPAFIGACILCKIIPIVCIMKESIKFTDSTITSARCGLKNLTKRGANSIHHA